jgi:hypothetical protein
MAMVGRRIKNSLPIGEKVGASGLPFTRTYQTTTLSIRIHDEDLVALEPIPGCLKDEFRPIEREVSLRILPPKRQLLDIFQMFLLQQEKTAQSLFRMLLRTNQCCY